MYKHFKFMIENILYQKYVGKAYTFYFILLKKNLSNLRQSVSHIASIKS
jgi:hypothetical protein